MARYIKKIVVEKIDGKIQEKKIEKIVWTFVELCECFDFIDIWNVLVIHLRTHIVLGTSKRNLRRTAKLKTEVVVSKVFCFPHRLAISFRALRFWFFPPERVLPGLSLAHRLLLSARIQQDLGLPASWCGDVG